MCELEFCFWERKEVGRRRELIPKLLDIEKKIVREVVRGDKHNLRKSANCNAQISVIHSAHWTDLCFAICRFSQVVFVTSNNFTHNLLFYFQWFLVPFFDIGSVLAVLRSGMLSFTWATARLHLWLFVAFVTAGCNVKSLPLPQCKTTLKRKCDPRLEKA